MRAKIQIVYTCRIVTLAIHGFFNPLDFTILNKHELQNLTETNFFAVQKCNVQTLEFNPNWILMRSINRLFWLVIVVPTQERNFFVLNGIFKPLVFHFRTHIKSLVQVEKG